MGLGFAFVFVANLGFAAGEADLPFGMVLLVVGLLLLFTLSPFSVKDLRSGFGNGGDYAFLAGFGSILTGSVVMALNSVAYLDTYILLFE